MKHIREKAGPPKVRSLQHVLRYASRKAPGLHEYEMHELIDGRDLRPGEKERLLGMLKNQSGMEWSNRQNEMRVAAAYVCIRLRLSEAGEIVRKELEKGVESPHVRFTFQLAAKSFEFGEELEGAMKPEYRLMRLLEMRNSSNPGERRLAEIVIENAGIKYGTVASW